MRIFQGFDNLPIFRKAVVTVGSFDGVHRGHLALLEAAVCAARDNGGESVVLTFDKHPRVVLGRAEGLRLLTSQEEKSQILESIGIDNLIIIPFDRPFSRLTQDEFLKRYLLEKVGMNTLVIGYNHRLGSESESTDETLVKVGEQRGFSIVKVEEWRDAECGNVSSTTVRTLISKGDVERANSLLSRPYMILGRVDGDGRLWVDEALKIAPAAGRYSTKVNGAMCLIEVDECGVIVVCDKEHYDMSVKVEILNNVTR